MLLEDNWGPSKKGVRMQDNIDATLGEGVADNKRIYVFLHSNLQKHLSGKSYLFNETSIGVTWRGKKFTGAHACKRFALDLAKKCPWEARKGKKFVRLDFYLPHSYLPLAMLGKRKSISRHDSVASSGRPDKQAISRWSIMPDLMPACNDDVAKICNKKLELSVESCYDNIQNAGKAKTVNFLVIDYAELKVSEEQVKIAKRLTERQVRIKKDL